jgi:two-component system chemotaxis response regulator CheB
VPHRPLVVIGASAGGVEALRAVVAGLPPALGAPTLVVLHTALGAHSVLPAILARAGPLPAVTPADGELLRNSWIYVAPPGCHLNIRDGRAALTRSPQENGYRPAIDPLFRSAVRAAGVATIGVVLSGTLDDGAAGLAAIVRHGGRALVQDPQEALHAAMPLAALAAVPGALVGSAAQLGGWIAELVTGLPANEPAAVEGDQALEDALWIALHVMEDRAQMHRQIADRARGRGAYRVAGWNLASAEEISESARVIRDSLAGEPRSPL